MNRAFTKSLACTMALLCSGLGAPGPDAMAALPPPSPGVVDFARDIQPILEASCLKCHSGEKPKGKFSLETRALALKGGQEGVDIVPGASGKSPLIQAVSGLVEDSEMPPRGKGKALSSREIAILRAWIDQGVLWPDNLALQADKSLPLVLPPAARRKINFAADVRPILAEHCYSCHGPKKQEAGLRWDSRDVALKGSEHGPVIAPGKSDRSKMIALVATTDPDKAMPQKGPRLTAQEIGILRAWIDQGADWPASASVPVSDKTDHWSFKRPRRGDLPKVQNSAWIRNLIDRFVLARLEAEGLKPSPEADKTTLIRRLSLDLLGLPPRPEEIEAFLADRSPEAYAKLVERFLASPHYGERWGRHWLDAARYADSNGYEKDLSRNIWPYRDWVIAAFNKDLPFDQFTTEQLAGDLLPGATLDQKVATGFLRNSMLNEEGGVDPEQFRVEALIDRMDTIGKAFLGLTINCAQCHNHKYDPITQKEYYQLFAFLNNDDEPEIEVPSASNEEARGKILKKIADLDDASRRGNARAAFLAWMEKWRAPKPDWVILDPQSYFGAVGTKFTKLSDKSLLATASSPPNSSYTITVRTALTNITALRLETLSDPNLPSFGPGRAKNGNFVLTEFALEARPADRPTETNSARFRIASADVSQKGFPVEAAIDRRSTNKTGWAIDAGPLLRNRDHQAVFVLDEPLGFAGGTVLTFTLKQSQGQQLTIGRVRLAATTAAGDIKADPFSQAEREMLGAGANVLSDAQERQLFAIFRRDEPSLRPENEKVDALLKEWPSAPHSLVLQARNEPRETHLFKRGDFQKPGEKVSPGVPRVLHPMKETGAKNRLALARWIIDPANPVTARAIVNRMWQEYFAGGLVLTAEDLGLQGEKPTHPGLLDWLATEFVARQWSMKEMHRLIVSSATYRQTSNVKRDLAERDPFNRLLGRASRFRVDGELVRDIALSVAGLMNERVGGPPFFPPIPEGVLNLGYDVMKWETSQGPERYRRSMYTFWKRSVPYPALLTFDLPSAENACVRRLRTDTPLQALTTLNDLSFQEAAQGLGRRIYGWKGDAAGKAEYGFRLCTGRLPTAKERSLLLERYGEELKDFEEGTARAIQVAVGGKGEIPEKVNVHRLAAWTMVGRVLLNLDETLSRE